MDLLSQLTRNTNKTVTPDADIKGGFSKSTEKFQTDQHTYAHTLYTETHNLGDHKVPFKSLLINAILRQNLQITFIVKETSSTPYFEEQKNLGAEKKATEEDGLTNQLAQNEADDKCIGAETEIFQGYDSQAMALESNSMILKTRFHSKRSKMWCDVYNAMVLLDGGLIISDS